MELRINTSANTRNCCLSCTKLHSNKEIFIRLSSKYMFAFVAVLSNVDCSKCINICGILTTCSAVFRIYILWQLFLCVWWYASGVCPSTKDCLANSSNLYVLGTSAWWVAAALIWLNIIAIATKIWEYQQWE